MRLTKAIRKTERPSEATIIPSFAPEGYSGSSESLSKTCASSRGVVSTIFFSFSCLEFCPEIEEVTTGTGVWFSMLRGASEDFVREREGNFMMDGGFDGIGGRVKVWSFISRRMNVMDQVTGSLNKVCLLRNEVKYEAATLLYLKCAKPWRGTCG